MKRFVTDKIVIATHNAGKLAEMKHLLADYRIQLVSAAELSLPEPEETGTMFSENAAIKAHAAAKATGCVAFADDSGLCVDALDGAPGLFSARWAGPQKNFQAAMTRLNEELYARGQTTPDGRRAHFVSSLVLAWPDGHQEVFEGRVYGALVWPPRGDQGFGYDAMFQPDGHTRTFGEMDANEKHGIQEGRGLSHRARAFLALARACLVRPEEAA
jgi:XTP/dITP diphosphohydrolase